jgi:hypothetical protein
MFLFLPLRYPFFLRKPGHRRGGDWHDRPEDRQTFYATVTVARGLVGDGSAWLLPTLMVQKKLLDIV